MDIQQVQSNAKRPNDGLESDQNKRMRPETHEEVIETTNITDLDNDCLEYIFKKLDLSDLLNVADSSKCFKQALDLTYASKYGKMKVDINSSRCFSSTKDCSIFLSDRLRSLKLLRGFGHLILDMRCIGGFHEEWARVFQYVNEFCADSLKKMEQIFGFAITGHVTKPFTKMEVLQFSDCNIYSNITDFNKWFPKMRDLTMIELCRVPNPKSIEQHFPNLQHLTVDYHQYTNNQDFLFDYSNITKFICLNPQLQSLDVGADFMEAAFIRSISNHLLNLEKLKIRCDLFYGDVIQLQRVKNFELRLSDQLFHCTLSGQIPKIPLSFDQLETFTVDLNQSSNGNEILTFLNQHRSTLNKVSLTCIKGSDPFLHVNKMELANAMELLKDLDFGFCTLTADDIIEFLRKCKLLKKFRFFTGTHLGDALFRRIGSEWRISTDKCFVQLESFETK